MDEIFQDAHGAKGAFTVVKIAKNKPRRYDKHGNPLINYDDTEYAHRRHSGVGGGAGAGMTGIGGHGDVMPVTGESEKKSSDELGGTEERRENA